MPLDFIRPSERFYSGRAEQNEEVPRSRTNQQGWENRWRREREKAIANGHEPADPRELLEQTEDEVRKGRELLKHVRSGRDGQREPEGSAASPSR